MRRDCRGRPLELLMPRPAAEGWAGDAAASSPLEVLGTFGTNGYRVRRPDGHEFSLVREPKNAWYCDTRLYRSRRSPRVADASPDAEPVRAVRRPGRCTCASTTLQSARFRAARSPRKSGPSNKDCLPRDDSVDTLAAASRLRLPDAEVLALGAGSRAKFTLWFRGLVWELVEKLH